MRRIAAACAAAALTACTTTQATIAETISLNALKANPQNTLRDLGGRRVRTAGYFMVDHLASNCQWFRTPDSDGRRPAGLPLSLVHLDLSRREFERIAHRWIVIDATIRMPKDMELGGGDLVIEVPANDQDLYLDDGKLVSVDMTKPACEP